MSISVAHLLANDHDLPAVVRTALAEGRPRDAGALLMDLFGLDCAEAAQLVDHDVCPEER